MIYDSETAWRQRKTGLGLGKGSDNMTAQELLDLADAMYPNAETVANKIKFMNIAIHSLSPYFGIVAKMTRLLRLQIKTSILSRLALTMLHK